MPIGLAAILIAVLAGDANAQKPNGQPKAVLPTGPVICPQVGVIGKAKDAGVSLKGVRANITVTCEKQVQAETKLNLQLLTEGKSPLHCDVVLPVQRGAKRVVVVNDSRAVNTNGVVMSNSLSCDYCQSKTFLNRRPSLLEFYGYDFLRVPNVAIPAGGKHDVAVQYRQTLKKTGNRYDYILPKSELLGYRIPWRINATIQSRERIATVYSPSHPISWKRDAKTGDVNVRVQGDATAEPGAFRMSWLPDNGGINGTVYGYPPVQNERGYFLLLLSASDKVPAEKTQKREVTVVIDRSASTRGKRLAEVQKVTNTVLKNLRAGEKFNIVTYNQGVAQFAKGPVDNTVRLQDSAKMYIQQLQPRGGSNIHGALKTALQQPASPNLVPIVLFFTDGLPTFGTTDELAIRNLVAKQNPANRRIFTFGVGVDLNTPLLQSIADESRGRATFVLPKEDITKKVGNVVNRLRYPVLTDIEFAVETPRAKDVERIGNPFHKDAKTSAAVSSVLPKKLPDMFAGEQLVILGRYGGSATIPFVIRGKYLGKPREFRFEFDPKSASAANEFVPRLWAGRRIAELVENIRQSGAAVKPAYAVRSQRANPKIPLWSQEILKLTASHGVLTEYTAFLPSVQDFDGYKQSSVRRRILSNFNSRAIRKRSGYGSVNQEMNTNNLKDQSRVNGRNRYWTPDMNPTSVSNVQQLGNGAYFRYGSTWVDGRLMNNSAIPKPKQTIQFGSKDYELLLNQLAKQGQQGVLALDGKILLLRKSGPVLVVPPKNIAPDAAASKRPK